ncbi:hypothetical protein BLS_007516 [Venturia inaequalis]|uniref:Uncharacterized protein n=1 Tax=Venturia inaequalis TaxID=5025 RepID=A0A8H3UA20_VENIN|nr:hypothetical protein BLS_007516 [Venturia inaequalis]
MPGQAEDVHQQALQAFIAKDYRRAWKLCVGFMARTADNRPLWIEVYVLRLQAYLLPSNVNAFMEDALQTCDEIEKSFEVQVPVDNDLLHLEQLRQQCEGHKKCFQSKKTMVETLAKKEVGAMDLGDLFDNVQFQKWAKQEMDSAFKWNLSGDTVDVSNGEKETEQEIKTAKPKKEDMNSRVLQLEQANKYLSGKLEVLQSLVCVVEELVKDNQELKGRIKALESYASDCHGRDLKLLKHRDEEHALRAQHLGEDQEWVAKHEFRPSKLTLQQATQQRSEESFVTADEQGRQEDTSNVAGLLSRLQL